MGSIIRAEMDENSVRNNMLQQVVGVEKFFIFVYTTIVDSDCDAAHSLQDALIGCADGRSVFKTWNNILARRLGLIPCQVMQNRGKEVTAPSPSFTTALKGCK